MIPVLEKIAAIKAGYSDTPVTATEPVFGYMTGALGFRMTNYDFQVNVMNDTEPSADQTAAFEKNLSSRSVKILFYNRQVADPTTERMQKLAVKSGVPTVGVTETEPDQQSYAEWMLDELRGVEIALKAKTP
jgi:zinc/manganese transport system substrate-binding protein